MTPPTDHKFGMREQLIERYRPKTEFETICNCVNTGCHFRDPGRDLELHHWHYTLTWITSCSPLIIVPLQISIGSRFALISGGLDPKPSLSYLYANKSANIVHDPGFRRCDEAFEN